MQFFKAIETAPKDGTNMTQINLSSKQLTQLPELPESLKWLNCSNNKFSNNEIARITKFCNAKCIILSI